MKKLRKISQIDCQLCNAHGLHLAVCDVFYRKKNVWFIRTGKITISTIIKKKTECLKKILLH